MHVQQRRMIAGDPPPAAMLLFYPGAGLLQQDASYRAFGGGYALDSAFIEFILPRVLENYEPGRLDEADAFMNPAGADDLRGLSPAIVATAGFDILRDVGRRFAERLRAEGTPVRYTNYPSLTHSFLQMTAVIDDAESAAVDSARIFGAIVRAPDAASRLFDGEPERAFAHVKNDKRQASGGEGVRRASPPQADFCATTRMMSRAISSYPSDAANARS